MTTYTITPITIPQFESVFHQAAALPPMPFLNEHNAGVGGIVTTRPDEAPVTDSPRPAPASRPREHAGQAMNDTQGLRDLLARRRKVLALMADERLRRAIEEEIDALQAMLEGDDRTEAHPPA